MDLVLGVETHRAMLRIRRDEAAESSRQPVRDGVGVIRERPYRRGQRRAALNATRGDVLKIVGCGAASQPSGCDGRDRHPVSAVRGGEDETRQARWSGELSRVHFGNVGTKCNILTRSNLGRTGRILPRLFVELHQKGPRMSAAGVALGLREGATNPPARMRGPAVPAK